MSSVSILHPEAECGLGQSSSAPRLRPHMLKECPSSAPCNGGRGFSPGSAAVLSEGTAGHEMSVPVGARIGVALSINGSATALYI